MFITLLVLIAIVVIGVLAYFLRRETIAGGVAVYSDRRRGSSQLVSSGEFVDGSRRMPVALALTDLTFYYENSDMQASLERQWIHEVEYDDELTTGQSIGDGTVLRLRCFSQKFEFLIAPAIVSQWKAALPPHRLSAEATT
jgi:hypothetical protein